SGVTSSVLQVLVGGSWTSPTVTNSENAYSASFAPPGSGTYQYRIIDLVNGETEAGSTGTLTYTAPTSSISLNNSSVAEGTVNGVSSAVSGSTASVSWAPDSGATSATFAILIGGAWSTYSASLTESSAGVSFALPAAGTYQYVITDYVNGVTEAQGSGSISFTAASSSISVGASVAGPGTVNSLSAGVTASETPIYNESGQIVGYTVTGSTVTVSWAVDSGVTSSSLKVLIGGAWQTYTPTVTESGTCSVSFAMPAAQTSQYIIADVAGGETEAQASGNIYFSGWNSGSAGSVSIQSESQLGGVGGFADLGNGNLGWTTGANSGDSVVFYYWTGSSWATAGVGTSGSYYYTNLSGLSGSYAFEIVYTASGAAAPYRVERGTVTINHSSTPASSSIGTPAQVGAVGGFENLGNGVFGWTTAKTSSRDSIVFHYKASGASSWAGTL